MECNPETTIDPVEGKDTCDTEELSNLQASIRFAQDEFSFDECDTGSYISLKSFSLMILWLYHSKWTSSFFQPAIDSYCNICTYFCS